MPRPQKKGPRGAKGKPGPNGESLAQITSKIDQSLSSNDHKRKKAPTEVENKQQQHRKRQRSSISNQRPENPAAHTKEGAFDLLAEIKALGGDEKDLELINGVDSDDEIHADESSGAVEKGLKDELLAFSHRLGFQNIAQEDEVLSESEDGDVQGAQGAEDSRSEASGGEQDTQGSKSQDSRSRVAGDMMFEPLAEWHVSKLPPLPVSVVDQPGRFVRAIEAIKAHAESLLEIDANKYRTSVFASSSHKFLSTIMSSGTLTDKISALTLAVQESPVHNIRAFDALMTLASKKSRAQAISAIGALVDLLGPGTLLPPDRRLRPFQAQPGLLGTLQKYSVHSWSQNQPLPGKVTESHLISWAYEDWLKTKYFKVIQLLEMWCSDEIEYSRMKAVDFVYGLLKEKPEQEANLLTLLVNKLGDRDRKIASRASYLLLQLQTSHPGMKPIIIRCIERDILLCPSPDHRSRYYAINTLNQTILSSKEPSIAESLIKIYFDLFVTLLKSGQLGIPSKDESSADKDTGGKTQEKRAFKSNGSTSRGPGSHAKIAGPTAPEAEAADKIVSALLTGVNRAAPFVGTNDTIMERHVDTLFRIAHSSNFNTGIQALMLIQHLSAARNIANDRFYRTLYESLLDPRLISSSKQALYLNLLMRALKSDVDVRRVKAFAKRMLQISSLHQPSFVCGLLYIVAHLRQTFPDLSALIEQPEDSPFDDDISVALPGYDGRKRDPEHSNAQRSCLWEMIPFQAHFHPSVSVFAATLLDKAAKVQKPDLESHTLIRFLDKFVYRNPKSTDSARGASIMQPLRASKDLGDIWLGGKGAGATSKPINSASFWKKKAEDVAADEVFFHEYFQHVAKEPKAATERPGDVEIEENDEDEVWKALVSTQADIEEEASEDGFDDLEELEMGSDDGSSSAVSIEGDDDDEDDDAMGALLKDSDDDMDSDGSLAADDVLGGSETPGKDGQSKQKSRRRALKDLPTFASVDDYEELLAAEEDGLS